ncbi:hypothetical protein AW168_14785 [Nocardia brasiliensis]|nr:hypothetical protein AW168_14785 [Nocardia brasiliensis]
MEIQRSYRPLPSLRATHSPGFPHSSLFLRQYDRLTFDPEGTHTQFQCGAFDAQPFCALACPPSTTADAAIAIAAAAPIRVIMNVLPR